MRIRHRIPTVFSLYMVDVMCCALGCVLLIWLDNVHSSEDKENKAAAKLAEADLRDAKTKQSLADAQQLLADAEKRAGYTSDQLKEATKDRDAAYLLLADLDAQLAQNEADRKELEKRLRAALARSKELDEQLKDRRDHVLVLERDVAKYLQELKDTKGTATDLTRDLKATNDKLALETALAAALQKDIDQRAKELEQLKKSLAELREAKAVLEKTVTARDKDLASAMVYRAKWEAAEERVQALEKQMTDRQKELAQAELNLASLKNEKKTWLDETARVKLAAESRFAGIQLTGKRVVFLVDMSGSMDLVDENTEAPAKWLGVRESLVKIMRSLPDLEKYQVIVFSDKTAYLFDDGGGWNDYDPRTSSDKVFKALSQIKPKGGTNMYAALETVFKLRASGLDTVYFFSDGLPNMGEGVSPEEARKMTELQLGEVLGKHIRKKLKTDWNKPNPRLATVRINTIGFFYESPDVGAFLWALARENDGSFVGMSKP
jgi:hypothetical protein